MGSIKCSTIHIPLFVHLFVFWRGADLAVFATRQQVPCQLYTCSSSTHVPLKSISVVTLPVKVALAHYSPFAPSLHFCFLMLSIISVLYTSVLQSRMFKLPVP